MNIRLVQLNNKSRQGTYIYIKSKGKPSRYYKLKEDTPIDVYAEFYKNKYEQKNTKTLKEIKTKYQKQNQNTEKKYKQKIQARPSINKIIKKGIGTGTIQNILESENQELNKAKKQTLQNLVLDQQLLQLLITRENYKKIKNRIECRISMKNNKNETLATFSTFNKEPEEIIHNLKTKFKQNETIDPHSKSQAINKLKFYGYVNIDGKKTGKLHSIQMQIIFRKGK